MTKYSLYKLAKAKKEYIDLDENTRMEITSPEDRAAAERIIANTRPRSLGAAFKDSLPASLIAAAISGVGSAAVSRGAFKRAQNAGVPTSDIAKAYLGHAGKWAAISF